MSMDHPLGDLEAKLLRAMWYVEVECGRQRSVVTLRHAIMPMNKWSAEVERALCNDGTEHEMVAEYYRALCSLVTQTPYADGRGNLRSLPVQDIRIAGSLTRVNGLYRVDATTNSS